MKKLLITQGIAAISGAAAALYMVAAVDVANQLPTGILGPCLLAGLVLVATLCGLLTAWSRESRWWMILVQVVASLIYMPLVLPLASRVLTLIPSPAQGEDLGAAFLFILVLLGAIGSIVLGTIFGAVLGPVWRRKAGKA